MWLTAIWLVMWLLLGNLTFTFGSGGAFWALVVAIIYDFFWNGYWNRGWVRRP